MKKSLACNQVADNNLKISERIGDKVVWGVNKNGCKLLPLTLGRTIVRSATWKGSSFSEFAGGEGDWEHAHKLRREPKAGWRWKEKKSHQNKEQREVKWEKRGSFLPRKRGGANWWGGGGEQLEEIPLSPLSTRQLAAENEARIEEQASNWCICITGPTAEVMVGGLFQHLP